MREVAGDITGANWDERFELGLAIFIAGIAAMAHR
jgi:hypothetical protein